MRFPSASFPVRTRFFLSALFSSSYTLQVSVRIYVRLSTAESPSDCRRCHSLAGQLPLLDTEVVIVRPADEASSRCYHPNCRRRTCSQDTWSSACSLSYIEVDLTRTSNLAAGLYPEKTPLIGVTPVEGTGRLRLPALTPLRADSAGLKCWMDLGVVRLSTIR